MNFRDFYNSIGDLPKCHSVIDDEWSAISSRLSSMWKTLSDVLIWGNEPLTKSIKSHYFDQKSQMLSFLTLFKNVPEEQAKVLEQNLEKLHKDEAEFKLKQEFFKSGLKNVQPQVSEDLLTDDISDIPIFFDDISKIPKKSEAEISNPEIKEADTNISEKEEEKKDGYHLVVLCHGVQGNHSDMIQIAAKIRHYKPEYLQLLSKANESDHKGELYLMGRRLAEEVTEHYKLVNTTLPVTSISFIAFSTGKLR